jgi:hypothetical protein
MAVRSRPLPARSSPTGTALSRRSSHHSYRQLLVALLAYGLALLALGTLVHASVQWAQRRLDDLRYGSPRTVQLDAIVGHHDQELPTHLTALNLHGQIVLIEIPGGDTSRITTLPGPYLVGRGSDQVVPRLALEDMDNDGHVDLLLTLRGETVVYRNHDGAFQPPQASTPTEAQP